MFCPYCGSFNAEENTVCCRCGGAFRTKEIQSNAVETPVTAETQRPKGRIWPPLLVLIVMFAVGLALFFTIRPAAPGTTDPAMPWFTVRDGELYFDESRYVGGPELTVPDAVMGQPITAIAESLPEHTVIPYRNIAKKDYPTNIPKKSAYEKTGG